MLLVHFLWESFLKWKLFLHKQFFCKHKPSDLPYKEICDFQDFQMSGKTYSLDNDPKGESVKMSFFYLKQNNYRLNF